MVDLLNRNQIESTDKAILRNIAESIGPLNIGDVKKYLKSAYALFIDSIMKTFRRCKKDNTVNFISTADKTSQRFSLEAFKFLGDHQFVYMHCRVKICNATDPKSRCAQGCLQQRRKRSLETKETWDEEYGLAQGPFMRKEEDQPETNLQESIEGLRAVDIKGKLQQKKE